MLPFWSVATRFCHSLCTPSPLQALDFSTLPAPPIDWKAFISSLTPLTPSSISEQGRAPSCSVTGSGDILHHCTNPPSPARHLQFCRQSAFPILRRLQAPESQWLWVTSSVAPTPKYMTNSRHFMDMRCINWGPFHGPFILPKNSSLWDFMRRECIQGNAEHIRNCNGKQNQPAGDVFRAVEGLVWKPFPQNPFSAGIVDTGVVDDMCTQEWQWVRESPRMKRHERKREMREMPPPPRQTGIQSP